MSKGIDVSDYQGTIGWTRVRLAGVRFAWVKATEGVSFVASSYRRNTDDARRAGVRVGAYHFSRPAGVDAALEAAHFLRTIDLKPGDLRPVLDFEAVADTRWAEAFVSHVYQHTGEWPVLYTYTAFLAQMRPSAILARCPLWLANYGADDGQRHALSPPPHTWGKVSVHQYTSKGRILGVTGGCDVNESLVPLDDVSYKPAPQGYRYYLVGRGEPNHEKVIAWARQGGGRGLALAARYAPLLVRIANAESKNIGGVSFRLTKKPRTRPPEKGDPFR